MDTRLGRSLSDPRGSSAPTRTDTSAKGGGTRAVQDYAPAWLRGGGHAQPAPAACARHDRPRSGRASLYTAERFPPNPPKSRQ